jgi:VIT1/CCC1 family predicted Fe2+/Mn2+ transporter
MERVVSSIHQVTDIMGEILTASQQQNSGIEQVNQAIREMDAVTQQNAALVEESAAAAGTLHEQADRLAQVAAVFKLHSVGSAGLAKPGAPQRHRASAAGRFNSGVVGALGFSSAPR